MVVCTFFQQGRCKFGDRCKFEHPGRATSGSSGNRFGALSGGFGGQASAQGQQTTDYGVTASDIKLDLTAGKGRPEWVFSAYAPNNKVPRQLFGGPQRELSMEELRLRHYEATAAGNMDQAIQEAQALWQESVKQMDVALGDLNGAVKYIVEGANEHPNRIDICQGQTGPQTNQSSPFGQPSAPAAPTGGFGNPTPSAPSAFGKPTFGQPAQPSPFGQPAAPGNPTPFGQPSALGASSAFGKPSTLGTGTAFTGSAFSQASGLGTQGGLGQPTFGQSGFGQAANQSPFGNTGFGSPSQPAIGGAAPFGAPAAASPFSQIQQQPQQPSAPFGQPAPANPFGAPAQQPATSGFGQPSGGGGFGQPSQTASPFGQPQQPQQPFGQPQPAANPFGAPAQQAPAPSPFSQAGAPQGVPVQGTSTGPRASIKVEKPDELNPLPDLQGQTMRNPSTRQLTMWKGRPVKYINDKPCYLHPQDNRTFVRINFPDGPPEEAALRDSQGKPEDYTPEIEQMYQFYLDNGYFKDGIIPAVPPKREWISFDF
ncbi:hypothetical protein N7523_007924 [Penicillium sp. IBT 18751x]|nr:hypothetical protein N7523_007924 [Penicillium sp. IBT 18751x]